ncbi:hypothetical protein WA158_004795 [Blastocystis sp. Blastoise]
MKFLCAKNKLDEKQFQIIINNLTSLIYKCNDSKDSILVRFLKIVADISQRYESQVDLNKDESIEWRYQMVLIGCCNIIIKNNGEDYNLFVEHIIKGIQMIGSEKFNKSNSHSINFIHTFIPLVIQCCSIQQYICPDCFSVLSQLIHTLSEPNHPNSSLLYEVLEAISIYKGILPFTTENLLILMQNIKDTIQTQLPDLHKLKGSYLESASTRIYVYFSVQASILYTLKLRNSVSKVTLDFINNIYPICDDILRTKSPPKAQTAAAILMEKCALFLPEKQDSIWYLLLRCLLTVCKDNDFQEKTAIAILQTLTKLCSYCVPCLPETADMIKKLYVTSTSLSRLHFNNNMSSHTKSSYELWKYPAILKEFYLFIETCVNNESKSNKLNGDNYLSSFTRSIIVDISSNLGRKELLPKIGNKFSYSILCHISKVAKNTEVSSSILNILLDKLRGKDIDLDVLEYIVETCHNNNNLNDYKNILTTFIGYISNIKVIQNMEVVTSISNALRSLYKYINQIGTQTNSMSINDIDIDIDIDIYNNNKPSEEEQKESERLLLYNEFFILICQLMVSIKSQCLSIAHWQNTMNTLFIAFSPIFALFPKQWDPFLPHGNLLFKQPPIKLYNNLWTYIIWSRLYSTEKWSTEFQHNLNIFAGNSPILVRKDVDIETDLELYAVISNEIDIESLKNELKKRVDEVIYTSIDTLSKNNLIYLLTIYEVELMRMNELHSFKALFNYLPSFSSPTSPLHDIYIYIMESLFDIYIKSLKSFQGTLLCDAYLTDHVEFLTIMFCNRDIYIQEIAKRFIYHLFTQFPYIKYNAICINTIAKCLMIIKKNLDPVSDRPIILKKEDLLTLPLDNPLPYKLDLPLKSRALKELYEKLKELLKEWLITDGQRNTEDIIVQLQNSCSAEVYGYLSFLITSDPLFSNTKNTFSNMTAITQVNSVTQQIYFYKGVIQEELQNNTLTALITNLFSTFKQYLVNQFQLKLHHNQGFKETYEFAIQTTSFANQNMEEEDKKPIKLLYKCAALCDIYREKIDLDILYILIWLPAYLMTESLIRESEQIYNYIMAEIPELEGYIVRGLCSTWLFTIFRKTGLFSVSECYRNIYKKWQQMEPSNNSNNDSSNNNSNNNNHDDDPNSFSPSLEYSYIYAPPSLQRDLYNDIYRQDVHYFCNEYNEEDNIIHDIYINIFKNLLLILFERNREHAKCICDTLFISLQSDMSPLRTLFPTKIKFLEFCLQTYSKCVSYKIYSNEELYVFYNNIILQLLQTYSNKYNDINISNQVTPLSTVHASSLCSSLIYIYDKIDQYISLYTNNKSVPSIPLSLASLAFYSDIYKTIYEYNELLDNNNEEEDNNIHTRRVKKNNRGYTKSIFSTNTDSELKDSIYTENILVGYNKLLLLFIQKELEEITVYNNPSREDNRITLSGKYAQYMPNVLPNQWPLYIYLAYHHNTQSLFSLYKCFPAVNAIKNKLIQYIMSNSSLYIHIPQCAKIYHMIVIIYIYIYIDNNTLQKYNSLLYWAPASLPTCVHLMSRNTYTSSFDLPPMNNKIIMLYITRSLSVAPPPALVFYLPQIVQSLRFDISKELEYYLIQTCKLSSLVTHQLMWALIAESTSDTQSNKFGFPANKINQKDPLPDLCNSLKDKVINSLSPAEKKFFDQEFSFFQRLIDISGELKQFQKEERKTAIVDILGKINSDLSSFYLYLPTQPQYRVITMNIKSASPMQSAAKAPYLLTFNAVKWDGPDEGLNKIKRTMEIPDKMRVSLRKQSNVLSHTHSVLSKERSLTRNPSLTHSGTKLYAPRTSISVRSVLSTDKDILRPSSLSNHLSTHGSESRDLSQLKSINMSLLGKSTNQKSTKTAGTFKAAVNSMYTIGAIFKAYDDCRQDTLALQVMKILQIIWDSHGFYLPLHIYAVTPARTSTKDLAMGGIIEMIANSDSRNGMGEKGFAVIKDYFIAQFGAEGSEGYEAAVRQFIRSSAAYAVAMYILWVKDRHNGNIMIDDKGNLIHIDFGFLLGISPGNDLGFERAAFKLSKEMYDLMTGPNEDGYKEFTELTIQGYLMIRDYWEELTALVECMADSGLPCFLSTSIHNFVERLSPFTTITNAAYAMQSNVWSSTIQWTTTYYDLLQKIQNGITSELG